MNIIFFYNINGSKLCSVSSILFLMFARVFQFYWFFWRASWLFHSFSLLLFYLNFMYFCADLYYLLLSDYFRFIYFSWSLVWELSSFWMWALGLHICPSTLLYVDLTYFDILYFYFHSVQHILFYFSEDFLFENELFRI